MGGRSVSSGEGERVEFVPPHSEDIVSIDQWVAGCLVPLAVWVFISGVDDLFLALAWMIGWYRARRRCNGNALPSDEELDRAPPKRIAIFVPLWREHRVIRGMIEHNIAANRYGSFDFFVGAYPNDEPTLAVIREAEAHWKNVHLALCPHDGPTSKADCLNWIYQRLLEYEDENSAHFDIVVTHDAEDLIHPDSLRLINYYGESFDMVQIPVLALPTPMRELTHGLYCDDFAQYQTIDVPARRMLGGFLPSNGVGTGFSRKALEKLAAAHSNQIFAPECLTEDYENGFRLHRLGCTQKFVPITRVQGNFAATREYFPRRFRAAIRQRTRWITGIALQSWERHGWSETAGQLYWFWRDRKGLVGNLVSPLANLIFVYGALTLSWSLQAGKPWGLAKAASAPVLKWMYLLTFCLQIFHTTVRTACVSRVYDWRFALLSPVRTLWGNWINLFATFGALKDFLLAKVQRRPLVWLKTEHAYPNRAALHAHKRRLGEVLVGSDYVAQIDVDCALAAKPSFLRLGEYLVHIGKLTVEELYEALSLQQNLPLEHIDWREVNPYVARSFPASIARKWKVLPFKVTSGRLLVAGPEVPTDEMNSDLRRFSSLDIRFRLITPSEFDSLASEFLPVEHR